MLRLLAETNPGVDDDRLGGGYIRRAAGTPKRRLPPGFSNNNRGNPRPQKL
jgi:hypothetical protein